MNSQEVVDLMKQQAELAATAATRQSQQAADAVSKAVTDGYRQTESAVKAHPMETLAICLGVGLVAGIVVGLSVMGNQRA